MRLCNQLLRVFKHSFWNFAQLFKAYWRCACVFFFCFFFLWGGGGVAHKNIIFWQNYCNFDFDLSDISLQYWLNVLRVMGEDGSRDKDWLRARGHHLCVTDTIFWFLLDDFPDSRGKHSYIWKYIYSRTSMARTLMAHLPWLFRTCYWVTWKNPISSDLG